MTSQSPNAGLPTFPPDVETTWRICHCDTRVQFGRRCFRGQCRSVSRPCPQDINCPLPTQVTTLFPNTFNPVLETSATTVSETMLSRTTDKVTRTSLITGTLNPNPQTTSVWFTTSGATNEATSTVTGTSSVTTALADNANTSLIVGGALGGVCVLLLIAIVVIVWQQKKRTRNGSGKKSLFPACFGRRDSTDSNDVRYNDGGNQFHPPVNNSTIQSPSYDPPNSTISIDDGSHFYETIPSAGPSLRSAYNASQVEGSLNSLGDRSDARGDRNLPRGDRSVARGYENLSRGERSDARGDENFSRGERTDAQSDGSDALGDGYLPRPNECNLRANGITPQSDNMHPRGDGDIPAPGYDHLTRSSDETPGVDQLPNANQQPSRNVYDRLVPDYLELINENTESSSAPSRDERSTPVSPNPSHVPNDYFVLERV